MDESANLVEPDQPPAWGTLQSLLGGMPEILKLGGTSLLVALMIHWYTSNKRRDRSALLNYGKVETLGYLRERQQREFKDVDVNAISIKDRLKSIDRPKTKKTPANDLAQRNYDNLQRDKDPGEVAEEERLAAKEKERIEERRRAKIPKEDKSGQRLGSTDETSANATGVQLRSQSAHPGMNGYYNWHSSVTSLYRIYAIPSKTKTQPAVLPIHPASERGNVPVHIEVRNYTSRRIDVFWVDYKGNEKKKGSMQPHGGLWTQTTYIGHPWTFRTGDGEENVVLKFVPFRAIPSIGGMETLRDAEGLQSFAVRDVPEDNVSRVDGLSPACVVEDVVLPEPPLVHIFDYEDPLRLNALSLIEMNQAILWSTHQIRREDAIYPGRGVATAKTLLRLLKNICMHPEEPKYRRIRISNRLISDTIYNTGGRGVLLALGFEEAYGNLECGGQVLSYDRIQHISNATLIVGDALKTMEGGDTNSIQPTGADGYGRANFGHADGMNF